jgi:hypothetical protein
MNLKKRYEDVLRKYVERLEFDSKILTTKYETGYYEVLFIKIGIKESLVAKYTSPVSIIGRPIMIDYYLDCTWKRSALYNYFFNILNKFGLESKVLEEVKRLWL